MKKFILGLIVGLLIPVIGGYLYIQMGMMPVATASAPLPMEAKIAHMALRARISKEAPKDSPVPADEANMTQGAHVYVENCAFCHGFPDQKPSFAAKGMFPLPPQLLSKDDMVTDDPVGSTYWKVANGIRLTGMPGFNEMLTPTQMWQVSQMLAHADKLPDATKTALSKLLPLPASTAPTTEPAGQQQKGKKNSH
ncbi:MAG TPA: cytochrome c [Candidatus Angelobacter sp.]|nr:cytochrome c [Candidatus Angelobacter sp.]